MDIILNSKTQTASFNGRSTRLTRLEFLLLQHLLNNANRICTRDEIVDVVWGQQFQFDTGTIDVHLNSIRRKLQLNKNRPIETIRRVGLCYHSDSSPESFELNISSFVHDWLLSHEAEIREAELAVSVHLDPFVRAMSQNPDTLRTMLDGIWAVMLPMAHKGTLRISTRLSMTHFSFVIDLGGIINELKIPTIRIEG